jgi:hypothetical protein
MTDPASPNPLNTDRPVPKPRRRYRRRALPLLADPTRSIFVQLPRCRACAGKLKTTRTECRDKEGVIRRMECTVCQETWAVSFEVESE